MSIYVVYICFPNFYCERYRIGYICRAEFCLNLFLGRLIASFNHYQSFSHPN